MSTRFQLINSAHDVPETVRAAELCLFAVRVCLHSYLTPIVPPAMYLSRDRFITCLVLLLANQSWREKAELLICLIWIINFVQLSTIWVRMYLE